MNQHIVHDYPPNYDRIAATFPGLKFRRDVIFAFGERIYNPHGNRIPPEVLAHEAVHGERQGRDIAGWWDRYLEDTKFRLAEELLAHQAEYGWLLKHGHRDERRRALTRVAAKLGSPLYGPMVAPRHARTLLKTTEVAPT